MGGDGRGRDKFHQRSRRLVVFHRLHRGAVETRQFPAEPRPLRFLQIERAHFRGRQQVLRQGAGQLAEGTLRLASATAQMPPE